MPRIIPKAELRRWVKVTAPHCLFTTPNASAFAPTWRKIDVSTMRMKGRPGRERPRRETWSSVWPVPGPRSVLASR